MKHLLLLCFAIGLIACTKPETTQTQLQHKWIFLESADTYTAGQKPNNVYKGNVSDYYEFTANTCTIAHSGYSTLTFTYILNGSNLVLNGSGATRGIILK